MPALSASASEVFDSLSAALLRSGRSLAHSPVLSVPVMLYRSLLRPLLFKLPPETAHEFALHALSLGPSARVLRRIAGGQTADARFGELRRFGLSFQNPVGVAAGFDKNGLVAPQLAALGFGFVEVGTVTNLPHPGNPRPQIGRA